MLAPLLPKGTILKVTAWHDNTTAKKSNPDPNQWVGWGDRTVDEMAHAWINIVYMKDEDFKSEQEKRRSTIGKWRRGKSPEDFLIHPTRGECPDVSMLCFEFCVSNHPRH